MSLDEYLAFEEGSPIKHEYVGGEVYAMSGVTTRHNLITLNVVRRLHHAARARGCRVFATDVKLWAATDRIYYPDIIVACGKAAQVALIIEEPTLIVEVTSPGTRATDRREKLDSYRRIASLYGYLIVEQGRRQVVVHLRQPSGEWIREVLDGDGEIALPVLDTALSLDDVYDDVPLPPVGVREEEWGEDGD
jgi:Uma2 family endonuclease